MPQLQLDGTPYDYSEEFSLVDGGGGGSKQRPSPVDTAVAKELTGKLFPAASDYFGRGTEGIYQGTRLGGTSDVTQQAQDQVLALAPQLDAQTAQLLQGFDPLLDTSVSSVEDIFSQADQYGTGQSMQDIMALVPSQADTFLGTTEAENLRSQQQLSGLIDQLGVEAGQQFASQILPQIGDAATAAGQYGSSRQGVAEGVAAGEVGRNLNTQIAQLLQQDLTRQDALRESALDRAFLQRGEDLGLYADEAADLRTLGAQQRQFDVDALLGDRSSQLDRALMASELFPALQQGQLLGTDLLSTLGGQLDAGMQLQLEDQIQMQEAQRDAELRRLQEYQGLLGYAGPQQFQGSTSTGGPSAVQDAAGAAALYAGLTS